MFNIDVQKSTMRRNAVISVEKPGTTRAAVAAIHEARTKQKTHNATPFRLNIVIVVCDAVSQNAPPTPPH